MSDDLFSERLDVERPLPAELRRHLEQRLIGGDLAGIDDAADFPTHMRNAIEKSMVSAASELFRGIAQPRPLPAGLRKRLERELIAGRASVHRLAVAAAIVTLLVASVAVIATKRPHVTTPFAAPQIPSAPPAPSVSGLLPPIDLGDDIASPPASPGPGVGAPSTGGGYSPIFDQPPPFTHVGYVRGDFALPPPASSFGGGGTPEPHASPLPQPPVQLGIAGSNAGFRAYIDMLNSRGGVHRHRIQLRSAQGGAPAHAALATVNLGIAPIATNDGPPDWVTGPLLETLSANEDLLHGRVFSLASAPVHQAHIAADALFHEAASPSSVAVIYQAQTGVFAKAVPDAIEEVLRARDVTVVRIAFDETSTPVFPPADAAFLSLDTAAAKTWLRAARSQGYAPNRGIAGIYSLLNPDIAAVSPDGVRVFSPYSFASATEMNALKRALGRRPAAADIHGWVTAKALALAMYVSDATSAADMQRALESMRSFETGFGPYIIGSTSHARAPHAITYEIEGGSFVAKSDFLTDRF